MCFSPKMLLSAGAPPDMAGDDGCKALIWAAKYGHSEAVEVRPAM